MEAQLKGAVLIALVVVPQWRCPILKPLSAKLPPKSETAPHSEWQNGKILGQAVTTETSTIRFRPLNDTEERTGSKVIVKFPSGSDDQCVSIAGKVYMFDKVEIQCRKE